MKKICGIETELSNLALIILTILGSVSAGKNVMKEIILGYGTMLDSCREEAKVGPELLEEFHHIWAEDYTVSHREIGCALICMSHKHELLHDDKNLNHDNIDDYVQSYKNGKLLSDLIVEMVQTCEKKFIGMEDHCDRSVKIFNCFKKRAFEEDIAPTFERNYEKTLRV